MAEIRPFRGIRYNQEAVGDISLVVAPPYDVIDERARDAYYNRHPYNVIRLILNRPLKSDKDPDQTYRRAAKFTEQWLARRILIRDPEPSLYLYRQRYIIGGVYKECTGIIARVKVEDFSRGIIKPHEETMPKPFEDRMKLLEHTMMNFDLVHALYSDPDEKLRDPILARMERLPLLQFQTPDGVWHDVWSVSDEAFIRKVSAFLGKRTLYIADGHHRYQTALEFKRRLEESGELREGDPRGYLLMMIVEMENPGLSLLPVHRVVLGDDVPSLQEFVHQAGSWFDIASVEVPAGSRSGQVYSLLKAVEEGARRGKVFGILTGNPENFLLARLKDGVEPDREIEGGFSPSYKNLDVTVLHKLLIERVLGVPPDRESVERRLRFTRDPLEAVRMVDSGLGRYAFFLNPTRVEEVKSVADSGEKMPQKSTYFYPKPCSGVVMCRVTEW